MCRCANAVIIVDAEIALMYGFQMPRGKHAISIISQRSLFDLIRFAVSITYSG
jgi:hypothetical protein